MIETTMLIKDPFKTDLFITDLLTTVSFITDPFETDHVHDRLVHIRSCPRLTHS